MKLTQYEVALHEAGHLVIHAGIGKGCADQVKIGKRSGWIVHHDWSLRPEFDLDFRTGVAAAGPAVERIRGRDPHIYATGDLNNMRFYTPHLDSDTVLRIVKRVEGALRKYWPIVDYAARFLLENMNRQGFVGKKACRRLFAEIRWELRIRARG